MGFELTALEVIDIDRIGSPGVDPGFRVRGAHLIKLRLAEGCAKMFVVFRVKNHDFTPKNHIFSNFRVARDGCAPWIRPCSHNIS